MVTMGANAMVLQNEWASKVVARTHDSLPEVEARRREAAGVPSGDRNPVQPMTDAGLSKPFRSRG
uniref:DUF680 domain-containing protein n=1 Tax=Macrostomum lignano TaxID=282301 RepID=A0A1I8GTZ8_9PLAT